MLDRLGEWKKFNEQIEKHIAEYTIPQYQDESGEKDQVGIWTAEDCNNAIARYAIRFGKNARGNREAMRDMIKVAHYAQLCYDKLKVELNELTDIY